MCVQVTIEEEFPLFMKIQEQLPRCVDSRLILKSWSFIEPVQIISLCVQSIVTSIHAIWVQKGYHHKDEMISQQLSPRIGLIQKELKDPIENVRCRGFPRMDPRRNQHILFLLLLKSINPLIL